MNTLPLKLKNTVGVERSERLIGSVQGTGSGPTIIAMAGMHGNEEAGVEALRHVFEIISAVNPEFRGTFWGVKANLPALEQQVRYVDEDMNRLWFPSIIREIRKTPAREIVSSERREIKELLQLIDQLIPLVSSQPTIIIDLHSFSAEGKMFLITARKQKHIQLLSHLQAPMIFGIEKSLRGTALRYYQDLGHLAFAFEGGQHQNKLTVYNITAALVMLLRAAGCIQSDALSRMSEFEEHLREYTRNVPRQVELVYQHIIEPDDISFKMRPGFCNFDRVKEGEWLASDSRGKIRAECDGFILMPLYQQQGNDGFFIVREQHS